MPEGDSIRRLADRIDRRFRGGEIVRSVFRMPQVATLDLTGRTLDAADATAKHLFLRWSDGWSLRIHLRMQGRVRFDSLGTDDEHRRRFELEFAAPHRGLLVGLDIPVLDRIRTVDEHTATSHLGPDVCGAYDHAAAVDRLRSVRGVALTAALLDQRVVAGLGNIYAVESPFICGIDPRARVDSLADPAPVLAVAAALIRTNASLGPQNTTGRRLHTADQHVLPSRRVDCPVCGDRLQRLAPTQSAWGRKTAWCPTCQPTGATDVDRARVARLLALHPARRLLDLRTLELVADTSAPVSVRR